MAPPSQFELDADAARLGVIHFLSKLQVGFSPEESVSDLADRAVALAQGLAGPTGAGMSAVRMAADVVKFVDKAVDEIAKAVEAWLAARFHADADAIRMAVEHIRNNLPALVRSLHEAVRKTAADFGVTDMAAGLYKAVTKTIESFNLRHDGEGVALCSGHPDIVATAIRKSVALSALEGLGEAALAGAKVALVSLTAGVGLVVSKVADVIELVLKFAVRYCEALALNRVITEARARWECRGQSESTEARKFAEWVKQSIDGAPVVAALIMNCGVAGGPMQFLKLISDDGVVVTQSEFDKGVTYLNDLKSAASDLLEEQQERMRIWSADPICAAMLKHAGEIGLVQREAASGWRAQIYSWTHQEGTTAKAVNWAAEKLGYKQSSLFGRL